jgi:hypothetical protein
MKKQSNEATKELVKDILNGEGNQPVFNLEDMYMLAAKVVDDIAANRMNSDWNLRTTPKMIADDFIHNGFKGHIPANESHVPVTDIVGNDWDLYPGNEAGSFDYLDNDPKYQAENEILKGKAVDMTEGNDNDKNPLILFLREETDLLKAEIIRLNKSLDEVTLLLSRT